MALTRQQTLSERADAAAREATAQKGVAQRSAAEATNERNLALATNKRLEGELYESTIQSFGTTWEHEPGEVARLVASVAGRKDKGWEWGYWHRLSKVAYTVPNASSGGYKLVLPPVDGASCVVYDENSAQRIDPRSGKLLRELWRLPPPSATVLFHQAPVFSRDGRWAVRDDGRNGLVLQDLDRGTVRPLPGAPAGSTLDVEGVSDDGLRIATTTHAGRSVPSRLTVWDALSGRALATRALAAPFPYCLGLSPDGRTALLAYQDDAKGLVGVTDWDFEKNRVGTTYAFPKVGDLGYISITTAFGPDGSRIVSYGSKVAVFEPGRAEPRLLLTVKSEYAHVSTSLDGRFLVTSNPTNPVTYNIWPTESQIWDFRSGALVAGVPANGVLVGDGRLFLGQTRIGLAGRDWRESQPYRETMVPPDRLPKRTDRASAPSFEGRTFLDPSLDDETVVWTAYRYTAGRNNVAIGFYPRG